MAARKKKIRKIQTKKSKTSNNMIEEDEGKENGNIDDKMIFPGTI